MLYITDKEVFKIVQPINVVLLALISFKNHILGITNKLTKLLLHDTLFESQAQRNDVS